MLDFEAIGANIHRLRVEHGYSQNAIAELLGVTHQALSRWELGLTAPTVDNLVELCDLFEVSLEQLLCLDKELKLDEKDIFKGHSRMFVVKKIANGECEYDIFSHFNLFFPQERMLLLRAVKEGKITADVSRLVNKLTPEEQRFLTSGKPCRYIVRGKK